MQYEHFAENLCFLLWRDKVAREHWPEHLARWIDGERARAHDLLRGAEPSGEEIDVVALRHSVPKEELLFSRLVLAYKVSILGENLSYLLDELEKGEKQELAAALGVHPTSISRWLRKPTPSTPRDRQTARLNEVFRLPRGTDLTRDALFLLPWPVDEAHQRRWLSRRIEELPLERLKELFPILERLLRD